MPAGLVQEPALTLSLEDEEVLRRYLHYFDETERYELWQRVAQLDAATGNIAALRRVVDDTPGGTIMRQCIASLAAGRISAAIDAEAAHESLHSRVATPRKPLPWRRNLTARIGSAGQWAHRRTHWLSLQDFDLNSLAESPVSLHWCHRTQVPLGLSRAIWASDDGTIRAMFELAPTPLARAVANLMANHTVGFSVGTETDCHQWAGILDPDEWAPSEGRTDLLVMRYPVIREVSVTPYPLFDDTAVEACF